MLEHVDKAGVRDLERQDLPAVGRLFQNTFRKVDTVPASLVPYLGQVFLDHPWADPDICSKVLIGDAGKVEGFIGVFPARLEWEGRPLRAAFAGSMMVEGHAQNPLAGARLLRAFLAGPQDISLTETANAVTLGMWQKLSLPPDLGYSLNWLRIFRPAAAAVNVMEMASGVARVLRPVGSFADMAAERSGLSTLRAPVSPTRRIQFQDATREEFRDALLTLKDAFPLRPQWDRQSLDWLLDHAARKRNFGEPTWRIGVLRSGALAGCYAYFGRPRGVGRLLQALCAPTAAGDLVDDLFAHADQSGCAGLRGAGHPWLTPDLLTRKAAFFGRTYYLAHARDKALLQPIQAGQALISGLAGENWMRLIGDSFD
jgi:hypothetical protein